MRRPASQLDLLQGTDHSVTVVDARQAAELLGLSRATLYRQLHEMPPRVRLSARRFGWRTADLAKWIEQRRIASAS